MKIQIEMTKHEKNMFYLSLSLFALLSLFVILGVNRYKEIGKPKTYPAVRVYDRPALKY